MDTLAKETSYLVSIKNQMIGFYTKMKQWAEMG